MTPACSPPDFTALLPDRAQCVKTSSIHAILKVTPQPDIISFAGDLPAPKLFSLKEVRHAADIALTKRGPAASVQTVLDNQQLGNQQVLG